MFFKGYSIMYTQITPSTGYYVLLNVEDPMPIPVAVWALTENGSVVGLFAGDGGELVDATAFRGASYVHESDLELEPAE